MIRYFSNAWLIAGFTPSQPIKPYPPKSKLDFTPYQAMNPAFVHYEYMPKDIYCPFLARPTKIYYFPMRVSLQIQFPSFWKWASWRSRLNALCHSTSISRNIEIGRAHV